VVGAQIGTGHRRRPKMHALKTVDKPLALIGAGRRGFCRLSLPWAQGLRCFPRPKCAGTRPTAAFAITD